MYGEYEQPFVSRRTVKYAIGGILIVHLITWLVPFLFRHWKWVVGFCLFVYIAGFFNGTHARNDLVRPYEADKAVVVMTQPVPGTYRTDSISQVRMLVRNDAPARIYETKVRCLFDATPHGKREQYSQWSARDLNSIPAGESRMIEYYFPQGFYAELIPSSLRCHVMYSIDREEVLRKAGRSDLSQMYGATTSITRAAVFKDPIERRLAASISGTIHNPSRETLKTLTVMCRFRGSFDSEATVAGTISVNVPPGQTRSFTGVSGLVLGDGYTSVACEPYEFEV